QQLIESGRESLVMPDFGNPRCKSLFGSGDQLPPILTGRPEFAFGVGRLALFRPAKMDFGDTERSPFLQDFAGRLRSRQSDEQADWMQGRRRGDVPKIENAGIGADFTKSSFGASAVDDPGVKGVARTSAKRFQQMLRARIRERQRSVGFLV